MTGRKESTWTRRPRHVAVDTLRRLRGLLHSDPASGRLGEREDVTSNFFFYFLFLFLLIVSVLFGERCHIPFVFFLPLLHTHQLNAVTLIKPPGRNWRCSLTVILVSGACLVCRDPARWLQKPLISGWSEGTRNPQSRCAPI